MSVSARPRIRTRVLADSASSLVGSRSSDCPQTVISLVLPVVMYRQTWITMYTFVKRLVLVEPGPGAPVSDAV